MTFPETAGGVRPRPAAPAHGSPRPTAALPGLAVCLGAGVLAWGLGQLLPGVSPLLVAILAGALWRNLAPVPARLAPGVAVSGKRLLRAGIVLLGLQVSLGSVLGLGAGVLAVVVASVTVTFCATLWIGHLLGIGLAQRLLIASGFSICGAAAVAGVDGVTRAKEEEVATAVALVVLFGTLMIPLVPFLGGALGLEDQALGIWIGASTHEVAQVVAAGGTVGGGALAVAVTVKLARVLMLAPIAAGVAIHQRRSIPSAGAAGRAGRPPIVPLFILGFIASMALRTTGALPEPVLAGTQVLQTLLLSAAMFALGLGVHVKSLLRLGYRAILLGALSTAVILATSLGGIAALGL
ncbi:putative sulfate exporter family transporter [Citricoccus sp. I39-566]|uniref:YeiH family protein n=1 Tax=Citricoccus sp. I39-566 TaxID=3073268 RepID=UPI00286AB2CC|nr:putative sulfate exporter family transporter [Citricoccus sp. I39-566]WMY79143.1 putative sulfate exporter family transporter [Citricoccus sp. I39-566]